VRDADLAHIREASRAARGFCPWLEPRRQGFN
jgi:hypothetical protein